jgi:hypothetical protein
MKDYIIPANTNNLNLISNFEEGITKEKLKKIGLRKDAVLLLNLRRKFDLVYEQNVKEKDIQKRINEINKRKPHYKLGNGKNLFTLETTKLPKLYEVYEMNFNDLDEINMDFLSNLPSLADLSIKFSNIIFNKTNYQNFFQSLLYLNLPCNNLNNHFFQYIVDIKTLKTLNLSGNKITGDLPDISSLKSLEELDLSFNLIKSQFLLDFDKINNLENIENNKISDNSTENVQINISNEYESFNTIDKKIAFPNERTISKTKQTFDEWQRYLKTNLQNFYHNISTLGNLTSLNLANNKIHFFDIDPFFINTNEGFRSLKKLDFSNNIIEEEIAILLVMNIPLLESLDLTGNPIVNKSAYTNIEYEMFKNRNILLAKQKTNDLFKPYIIKKTKAKSFRKFNLNVKSKVAELSEQINRIQSEINNTKSSNDILDNNFINYQHGENIDLDIDYKLRKILVKNNNADNFFLTEKPDFVIDEEPKVSKTKVDTYDEFLRLANNCFGKEIHYKNVAKISIPMAYQRLRFVLNSLTTELNENVEEANYMKNTISRTLRTDRSINNS